MHEDVNDQVDSYAHVLQGNHLAANGLNLEYNAPVAGEEGVFVCLSDDDLAEETKRWENSLVMYVV